MTNPAEPDPRDRAPRRRRTPLWIAAAAVVAFGSAALVVTNTLGGHDDHAAALPTASATPHATTPPAPTIDATAVAALPEARYDAVIPGLLPFTKTITERTTVFHLTTDAPLFGAARTDAVARFAASDFLGQPTTVVGVRRVGAWELVLTPARQELPSKATTGTTAAAQTAAWVPASFLTRAATPTQRVVISTARQTVEIVGADGAVEKTFPAGVGTKDTPTPTGVTGYLEERYVDPSQGTGDHPIQLTSLHSSAADEPYGGADGGLIGVHYLSAHTGAVSHGCVRLDADAVAAVNALPLGTLVTVE